MIIEKKADQVREETYTQPLLTKHDALHALTGASGVKTNDEKSPNEGKTSDNIP